MVVDIGHHMLLMIFVWLKANAVASGVCDARNNAQEYVLCPSGRKMPPEIWMLSTLEDTVILTNEV